MKIACLQFNPIQENTYVVWDDTNECIVIDAGNSSPREDAALDNFIARHGLKPVLAANTHGHFDHTMGVEHLKQRSRRIALEVAAYLVDFVEQQYGIGSTGTLYGIDYTTRHRSYISATVSAYFSFIMKAAQRYTLIFASERARHRLAQRGLSHSGRSYKAENRSLALRVVKQHGYLLKDTLLDLGKSIMVGIKDILCQIEIGIQVRILVPRQFKQGFYIGILNRIVGALRIQSCLLYTSDAADD